MSDDSVMAMASPPKPPDAGEARRRRWIQYLQMVGLSLGVLAAAGTGVLGVISYMSDQRAIATTVSAMRVELSAAVNDLRAVGRNYPLLEQRVTTLERDRDTANARNAAQDDRINTLDRTLAGTVERVNAWTTPPLTPPVRGPVR